MRADRVGVHLPARHALHQVLHVAKACHPRPVNDLLVVDEIRARLKAHGAALAHKCDPAPPPGSANRQRAARGAARAVDSDFAALTIGRVPDPLERSFICRDNEIC